MGLLNDPKACALERHWALASAWHPAQLSVSVTVSPVSAPASSACAGARAESARGSTAAGIGAASKGPAGVDVPIWTIGGVPVAGAEHALAQATSASTADRTAAAPFT